jgi:hypothetical protein
VAIVIVPRDLNDCRRLLIQYRCELAKGKFDLQVVRTWVPKLSADEVRLLISHCPSSHQALATARLPDELFIELVLKVPQLRATVASNGAASDSVLRAILENCPREPALIGSALWTTLASVACSQNASAEILEALFASYGHSLGHQLALNPNTPSWILDRLFTDPGSLSSNHLLLARHPNTPADILDILSRSPDARVRDAATKRQTARGCSVLLALVASATSLLVVASLV